MPKSKDARELCTPAWRLIGWTVSEPGYMSCDGRRLCYANEDGLLFDAALGEVADLVFPWYYFGGGLKLTIKGERHRFSFVVPNGAEVAGARALTAVSLALGAAATAEVVAAKIADITDGRAAGRAWRELLEPLVRKAPPAGGRGRSLPGPP